MSFVTVLETLLLGPLKLVFEVIFQIANRFIGHPGLAIIVLSLIMNILVLPLYKRADAMQEASRDIEAKLKKGVDHIKKSFTGDERMMILQTYYRQNHYKPTQALNGSVSLLLEIPFFMAAYQFLSHLQVMDGVSFGPIADLSKPDGLLVIGSIAINVLPVLMTLVNVISSAIYLKGFPLKTKIQLYGMALFFLVFLYESPACLVFYWTLNNVFSLVKTVFYKIKNPRKVLSVIISLAGLALLGLGIAHNFSSVKRKIFLIGVGVALQLPLILMLLKGKLPAPKKISEPKPNKALFLLGSVFLTILIGALIPSTFIAASPQEYVDISYFHNPLWYILSAFCLAAGTFLVWMRVFYWLASPKGKVFFDRLVWVLCGVMLVNYMFFGTDLGVISSTLQYENTVSFSGTEQLLNLLVLAAICCVMYLFVCKWSKAASMVLLTASIALGGMSVVNMVTVKTSVDEVIAMQESSGSDIASIELSKTGKNVVVFMLDRGMGQMLPYIFNEKPELKESFSGFTYYTNVVSYGGHTNFCAPALYGGYEYTPVELNKRDSERLVEKHNEAIKMLPKIFSDNGYNVTLCDPVYANYQWIPDLTIFDDIPNTEAYITEGKFTEPAVKQAVIDNNYRNFFCFSIMKTMPLVVQPTVYNGGQYNQAAGYQSVSYGTQVRYGLSKSEGLFSLFMEPYNALSSLPYITKLSDSDTNTFVSLVNNSAHEPQLLQTPDYTPAQYVDNTEYDAANTERFTVDGTQLKVENETQMIHYHANMAAMLKLGQWFDHLRELGVWDNTRIVLVSDHGQALHQLDALTLDDGSAEELNLERYYPMLLVKDFGSTEFTTSDAFMTVADVPSLLLEGLVEDPVNPYTGNPITMDEKYAHEQYVITSGLNNEWDVNINNGYTYLPSTWLSVKDDIWNPDNWSVIDESLVLKEHAAP